MLRDAIRETATYIKNKEKDKEATTIAHRLASTLSFIRAIECGDIGLAQKLQKRNARLRTNIMTQGVAATWLADLKDHAVELMHNDIGDRVQELKVCKSSLAKEIYERKKDGIARRLRNLLPAGGCNEVSILIKKEATT